MAVLLATTMVFPMMGVQASQSGPGTPFSDSPTTSNFPEGCSRSLADGCYHMKGGLNALDSPKIDVLLVVPASPYAERDLRAMEQAIDMYEAGIKYIAAKQGMDWLAGGVEFHVAPMVLDPATGNGGEFTTYPVVDPEIVIIRGNPTFVPVGLGAILGIGIDPLDIFGLEGPCHGLANPFDIEAWEDLPGFDSHHDGRSGTYSEDCGGAGGNICFAVNGGLELLPDFDLFGIDVYDLIAHEVGHCLRLGHVGDAGTEFSAANAPLADIMSYAGQAFRKCVSSLDVETFAVAMSPYLDVNGDGIVTGEDRFYYNDHLGSHGGSPFQVQNPADHYYASSTGDARNCPQPDLELVPGANVDFCPEPGACGPSENTRTPAVAIESPNDGATVEPGLLAVSGVVDREGSGSPSAMITNGDQIGQPDEALTFLAAVTGAPSPMCIWTIDAPSGDARFQGATDDCSTATVISTAVESVTVRLTATNENGFDDATAAATWTSIMTGTELGTDPPGDIPDVKVCDVGPDPPAGDGNGDICVQTPGPQNDIVRIGASDEGDVVHIHVTMDDFSAVPERFYAGVEFIVDTVPLATFSVTADIGTDRSAAIVNMFVGISGIGLANPLHRVTPVTASLDGDTLTFHIPRSTFNGAADGTSIDAVSAQTTVPTTTNYRTIDETASFGPYTIGQQADAPGPIPEAHARAGALALLDAPRGELVARAHEAPDTSPEGRDGVYTFGQLPLVAHAGGPYGGAPDSTTALTGSFSGGAGDATCTWTTSDDGNFASSGSCDTAVTFATEGEKTVHLTVADATGSAVDDAAVTASARSGERVDLLVDGAFHDSHPVETGSSTTDSWTGQVDLTGLSGEHAITVEWYDSDNQLLDADSVTVTVESGGNEPPTAVAVATPEIVAETEAVTLDGSGSTDDGTVVTHQWAESTDCGGTINDDDQPIATWTAPVGSAGKTCTFELTVTDDGDPSLQGTDSVSVTVEEAGPGVMITSPTQGATLTKSPHDGLSFAGTFDTLGGEEETQGAPLSGDHFPVAEWLADPHVASVLSSTDYGRLVDALSGMPGFIRALPPVAGQPADVLVLFDQAVPAGLPERWGSWTLVGIVGQWSIDVGEGHAPEQVIALDELAAYMNSPSGPNTPGPKDGLGPGSALRLGHPGGGTTICTASWLFREPGTQQYYLSTAGHCLLSSGQGPTTGIAAAQTPGTSVVDWVQICFEQCTLNVPVPAGIYLHLDAGDGDDTIAFAQMGGAGITGEDFGLIKIPQAANSLLRPWMPTWSGATGSGPPPETDDSLALIYGHGAIVTLPGNPTGVAGALLTRTPADQARANWAPLDNGDGSYTALGWTSGGDSGSATGWVRATASAASASRLVIGDQALGTHTHGLALAGVSVPGLMTGTLIDKAMAMVADYDLGFAPQLVLEDEVPIVPPVGGAGPIGVIASPEDGASFEMGTGPFTASGTATFEGAGTPTSTRAYLRYAGLDGGDSGCGNTYLSLLDGPDAGNYCGSAAQPSGPVVPSVWYFPADFAPVRLDPDGSVTGEVTLGAWALANPHIAQVDFILRADGGVAAKQEDVLIVSDDVDPDGDSIAMGSATVEMQVEDWAAGREFDSLTLEIHVKVSAGHHYVSMEDPASFIVLPLLTPGSEGQRVELSVDDDEFGDPITASGTTSWTAAVPLDGLSVGGHTLYARAVDGTNIQGTPDSITFTVTDASGPEHQVQIRLDGPAGQEFAWRDVDDMDAADSGEWTHAWNPSGDLAAGGYTVHARLVDSLGDPFGAVDDVSFSVSHAVENQPPTADAGADRTVPEGSEVTLDGSGSRDDGTIASYAWNQLAGPGVVLSGADTATPTFTAPNVAEDTQLEFELTVTDDEGASASDGTVVTVTANRAPVIDPIDPVDAWAGDVAFFEITATDADGDPVALAADNEHGAFTDHGDGSASFTWATDGGDVGTYAITVTANDGRGGEAALPVAVEVLQRVAIQSPADAQKVAAGQPSIEVTGVVDGMAAVVAASSAGATAWSDPSQGGTGDYIAIDTPAHASHVAGPTQVAGRAGYSLDGPDANGDGWVVIAVVDSGINPYNQEFEALPAQPDSHPSQWIDGYPQGAQAIELACTATEAIPTACASDFAGTQDDRLYWFPGTKIIGAYSMGPDGTHRFLDENGHGTRSASVAAGNSVGTCPKCLIVVVDDIGIAQTNWAASQPWIDIVTNSWGAVANAGAGPSGITGLHFYGVDPTQAFAEDGGSMLFAAGNGLDGNFLTPVTTYQNELVGSDWHYVVGAAVKGSDTKVVGSGFPVITSSWGTGTLLGLSEGIIPAACHNTNAATCGHSGTSAATPITAGVMGSVLARARGMLDDGTPGPDGAGVAAAGTPVAGNPWLADGKLERKELWTLVAKTARPLSEELTDPAGVFVNAGRSPVDYLYTGYGIVDETTKRYALDVLAGRAELADRSDVDAWMSEDSSYRRTLFGDWDDVRFGHEQDIEESRFAPMYMDDLLSAVDQAIAGLEATPQGAWPGTEGLSRQRDTLYLHNNAGSFWMNPDPNDRGASSVTSDHTFNHDDPPIQQSNSFVMDPALDTVLVLDGDVQFNLRFGAGCCAHVGTLEVVLRIGQTVIASHASELAPATGYGSWTASVPVETTILHPIMGDLVLDVTFTGAGTAFLQTGLDGQRSHLVLPIVSEGDVVLAVDGKEAGTVPVIGGAWQASIDFDAFATEGGYEVSALYYGIGSMRNLESQTADCDVRANIVVVAIGPLHDCSVLPPDGAWSVRVDGAATLPAGNHKVQADAYASDGTWLGGHTITVRLDHDVDGDGAHNGIDNCPDDANPGQGDADGDGVGDVCDGLQDADGDFVADGPDNCPTKANPGQSDVDGDGTGDACDAQDNRDSDGDGVENWNDACPGHPDTEDLDSDGRPDACEAQPLDGFVTVVQPTRATLEGPVAAISPDSRGNYVFEVEAHGGEGTRAFTQWRVELVALDPNTEPGDPAAFLQDVLVLHSQGSYDSEHAATTNDGDAHMTLRIPSSQVRNPALASGPNLMALHFFVPDGAHELVGVYSVPGNAAMDVADALEAAPTPLLLRVV